MDPSIPVEVCKLKDTIENKIEDTFKVIQQKVIEEQNHSKALRSEIKCLLQENVLLDKEIICVDGRNKKLEGEILSLKLKAEETACSLERIKWKICKTELLKEFEKQINGSTYKRIHDYEESYQFSAVEVENIKPDESKQEKKSLTELKERIVELKEEIEKKRRNIKMADPKLSTNIKILEKRNAALLIRYQRQLAETQSRYRQTLLELNSLKRKLEEKKKL